MGKTGIEQQGMQLTLVALKHISFYFIDLSTYTKDYRQGMKKVKWEHVYAEHMWSSVDCLKNKQFKSASHNFQTSCDLVIIAALVNT